MSKYIASSLCPSGDLRLSGVWGPSRVDEVCPMGLTSLQYDSGQDGVSEVQ